jgi:hypothetical protein
MCRLLVRFKRWYAWHRAQARMGLLAGKCRWLEEECIRAGEFELASMVAIAWEARYKGEQSHAFMCLLYRDRIEFVRPRVGTAGRELRLWP